MFSRTLVSWGRMLGLGGKPQSGEERRHWGRIPCDIQTSCRLAMEPSARICSTRVRNVSRGGIALDSHQPYRPGQLLSVSLPNNGGDDAEVLACVVRAEPSESGVYELGCTWAAPLTDEELDRFSSEHAMAVVPDQRAWVRYDCRARAWYSVVRAPAESSPQSATVLNISAGGVALRVPQPISVGDLLSLDLYQEDKLVVTALASVVRTHADGSDARVIGCNFIRALSDAHITALL